jgi:hypothetical protein
MSSAPLTSAHPHSRGAGHPGRSRHPTHAASTAPATRKRTPPIRNGGSVATATRMARYVEPQTT